MAKFDDLRRAVQDLEIAVLAEEAEAEDKLLRTSALLSEEKTKALQLAIELSKVREELASAEKDKEELTEQLERSREEANEYYSDLYCLKKTIQIALGTEIYETPALRRFISETVAPRFRQAICEVPKARMIRKP